MRSHPRRIASSAHVLSISTFQVRDPAPCLYPTLSLSPTLTLTLTLSPTLNATPTPTFTRPPARAPYPHPHPDRRDPNPNPNPNPNPSPNPSWLALNPVSTCQRNRSCCEFVQGLVAAPEASRAEQPQLYLLHMGNLGKLPDSSVPPSMRQLGLALQDQFVPRSEQPCATEASNPQRPPGPRQACDAPHACAPRRGQVPLERGGLQATRPPAARAARAAAVARAPQGAR